MSEKRYTIKPLVWQSSPRDEFHHTSVLFGSYSVEHTNDRGWRWSYCFGEYYDEDNAACDDLESGKSAAQAHWEERIKAALVEVSE